MFAFMDVQKIIAKPKRFLALTSLHVSEFEELLSPFSSRWRTHFKHYTLRGERRSKPLTGVQMDTGTDKLPREEDKLFFILYLFKNNSLQEAMGEHFDIDQSHVSRWVHILTPILQQAIKDLLLQPARNMDELIQLFRNRQQQRQNACAEQTDKPSISPAESLHADGVERAIQRNTDQEAQKHDYSGKKRGHRLKNTVVCDEFQFIHFAPHTHRGAIHDKAMIEDELPDLKAFEDYHLWFSKDSGYQAYEPSGVYLIQPYKATRGHPLTDLEKLTNSYIASTRVVIEHAISGVKRCRLLKDPIRYFDSTFRDAVFFIGCGLHNLRVSRRKPYIGGAARVRARINLQFL